MDSKRIYGREVEISPRRNHMTYERYKTGMFRVCVFLTIILEFVFFVDRMTISGNDEMLYTPIYIWGTYFFSLWIYKGFLETK